FGIVLPLLPLFAKEFGAGPLVATTLVASYSAAQFAAAPLWGRLSDRVGRKPVLVCSLIGTAAGYAITASANVVWVLFAGRIIDGLTGSTFGVAHASPRSWLPHLDVIRRAGGSALARLALLGLLATVAFSGFESTFSLLLDHRFDARHGVVYALFTAIGLAMVVMQGRVVGPFS